MDERIEKGVFDRLDHYAVLGKIEIRDRWEYGTGNDNGKVSEVIASERMDGVETGKEQERSV